MQGVSHAMQQSPCMRDKANSDLYKFLLFILMLKFLPLDGSFEQRHYLLKANVKKKPLFIVKEH